MRIAFFSPLPPAKSGIADYSAALLERLTKWCEVSIHSTASAAGPVSEDARVYQLGNNPEHEFVYEAALAHPGVVVLHEANLHYLVAGLTLHRGNAEAYWSEVEHSGGHRTAHPDYRIPLLRSVLARSRAAIVHSEAVERVLRAHGFTRPIGRIPHGAWIAGDRDLLRVQYREKLGLADEPLFGVFGFLKPYKRIHEIVRAFKRLLKEQPQARLILVGERHPQLSLDLPPEARHIDFVPANDFTGYMAACDAVLNLRFPTVGESSGTLMRAFGLGKASVVSDLGSFRELPDDICLKVPVDRDEDELLLGYMRLLVARPDVRAELGLRAQSWAGRECSWELVAQRYAAFLKDFESDSLPASDAYVETHRGRLEKTLSLIPPGGPEDWILEMGAYMQMTPALQSRLGYGVVRGSYLGETGKREICSVDLPDGGKFECQIDHFDAEKDFYPYPSAHFWTVLCCELLEHLTLDPMHMMEQIHRIVRPGGHIVLTTPNITSLRAARALLQGYHPMMFSSYIKNGSEPRHSREYTPNEIRQLLENSGFEVLRLETGPFHDDLAPEHGWVEHVLDRYMLPREHRGDGIFAVGRKIGPVRERYPGWLYT